MISEQPEVLAGVVERVTFHNGDTGFCVLRVGHTPTISPGEWITATGDWVNDRTHGQQFKARFLRASAPSSAEGIERYLGSGMIRGIGRVYARKMVKAFGEKVFDVIEAEPDRLREVDGIGPLRAQRITAAWAEQKIVREIMVFLHSHGVGTARAVRIYRTYGVDRAGISYALTQAMDEGHCGLPTSELVPLATEVLDVPHELVETALDLEMSDGTVVGDAVDGIACVFLSGLYRAEQVIAERLRRLADGPLPWAHIDPDKALPWVQQKIGMTLAETQTAAIGLALLSKVLVITGGPGVGKTTIVKAILRILAATRRSSPPTLRRSTRAKVPNILRSSSRS